MGDFLSAMFAEIAARRRRLREAFGDRGQGLAEFLVLAGVLSGSLGLLIAPWMPGAAPWGFAVPFVFLLGYFVIEGVRQARLRVSAEPENLRAGFDWIALLWSFACALAGAAAFAIALGARPPPDPLEWAPPNSAVSVEISP
jgi:hypothetical protein